MLEFLLQQILLSPIFDNIILICFLKVNEFQDMLGADNLLVSSKIKDVLDYVEEFKELFDDERSAITIGRREPGLETEQADPTEIKQVNTLGNIPSSFNFTIKLQPPIKIEE
ncbi:hypothetical protein FQA39_LY13165 [Lamprigera yunnana]|nr:hypothetical protein FQA39_LY13165 [Lamprigera yunnana]